MKRWKLFVAVLAILAFPAVADVVGPDPTRPSTDRRETPRDVAEDERLCPVSQIAKVDLGKVDGLPEQQITYCIGAYSVERQGDYVVVESLMTRASWSREMRFNRKRVMVRVDPRIRKHLLVHATLLWHGISHYPKDAILFVRTDTERVRWQKLLSKRAVACQ